MCGIAGSWRAESWNVKDALDVIDHRGPDGKAVAFVGDAIHGHVRLAIMDPTPRSDQPFEYEGLTLSYVGECWNYLELREYLETAGYRFRTTGDTEVVAAALHLWGEAALSKLEGQYAFAWTDQHGITRLARDRFGEVPLYVLHAPDADLFSQGTGVMWSSERKAFGERGAEAEPVPAGGCVELREGGPRGYAYYEQRWATVRSKGCADPKGVLRILERAIERRLQSDVPVCCLISGGIDSSLILRLVKDRKPDVVAYTIVFDEDSEDLREARFIADHLGVELREVPVPLRGEEEEATAAAIGTIEITMKAQIEIAIHCLPLAHRIYKDGFRVVLSGEGADELFGGYGMLARHSKKNGGRDWPFTRLTGIEKMARGNFVRINKAFMAHGVEARTPYMDRDLIEAVLPLYRDECPEQKLLLRGAAEGLLPDRTRLRRKVSFQSGSGMRSYMEEHLDGQQQIRYNQIARELFGGIPRG